ncbi:MAG: hypothetical protein HY359_01580 [Candidatus Rokubacteria bacterium]|nr:hypothetical protein [Candidatus Rokubacteria bacterium]
MFGRKRLACSFCLKGEAEVAKLVAGPRVLLAGPRVYICDRCVALANQIMGQHPGDEPRNPEPRHRLVRRVCRRIAQAWQRGGPWSSPCHADAQ